MSSSNAALVMVDIDQRRHDQQKHENSNSREGHPQPPTHSFFAFCVVGHCLFEF